MTSEEITALDMGGAFATHYLAGITLAFTDRRFSQNAKKHTDERVARKIEQAEALEYLVQHSGEESSPDYARNILTAKEYFRSQGEDLTTENMKTGARISEKVARLRPYERLNNLAAKVQLGTAFSIEVVGDAIVGLSRMLTGVGHPLDALEYTLAQTPGLFLGLQTGKGILYLTDLKRSKDEKEIDGILKQLTGDDKLLQVVKNYSLTASIPIAETPETLEASPRKILTASEIGSRLGEQAYQAAGKLGTAVGSTLGAIKSRITEKRNAEEATRRAKIDAEEAARKKHLEDFARDLRK